MPPPAVAGFFCRTGMYNIFADPRSLSLLTPWDCRRRRLAASIGPLCGLRRRHVFIRARPTCASINSLAWPSCNNFCGTPATVRLLPDNTLCASSVASGLPIHFSNTPLWVWMVFPLLYSELLCTVLHPTIFGATFFLFLLLWLQTCFVALRVRQSPLKFLLRSLSRGVFRYPSEHSSQKEFPYRVLPSQNSLLVVLLLIPWKN